MGERLDSDDNDPKTSGAVISDSVHADVYKENQNQKDVNNAADDNQERIGDHSIDANFVHSGDDINCYQKWLADFHIEQQYQKEGPNVARPPPLFEGDIVCYHEIFEWLSLVDIHSVGQTCKRLQVIAGDFFKCYLSAAELHCTHRGIESNKSPLNGFRSYVRKIMLGGNNDRAFHHIASIKSDQLKIIEFRVITDITSDRVKHIEGILKNIEVLKLFYCRDNSELYSCLLQFCPNLKHLIVKGWSIETKCQWLYKKHAKLERIELYTDLSSEIAQAAVSSFFKLNPQIKNVAVHLTDLWCNKEILLNSKIQLDVLAIYIDYYEKSEQRDEVLALLHQLYDQGFYKRLYVCVCTELEEAVAALPGLEMVKVCDYELPFNSSNSLKHLKELTLDGYSVKPADDLLATKFPNLERLNLFYAYCLVGFKLVLPFLQCCAKLNKIEIRDFKNVLNLSVLEWNKEREKLAGARKVIIFVREKDFLAAKWSNQTINMKFIEIRRADSRESNEYFRD